MNKTPVLNYAESLSIVLNTNAVPEELFESRDWYEGLRRQVRTATDNQVPPFHVSFEPLLERLDGTVTLLASLESDWSTLRNAQFTLEEEDRRIAHEKDVEIVERIKQIESQKSALKLRAANTGKEANFLAADFARWTERANAATVPSYGHHEYGSSWGGVNVFGANNATASDGQFPPMPPHPGGRPWNFTEAMLYCNRWLAEWSAANAIASFKSSHERAASSKASAEDEGRALIHEIARLDAELSEVKAREGFLKSEQTHRTDAVDNKILDYDRRAAALLVRGAIYTVDAKDLGQRLMMAAAGFGFDTFLGAESLEQLEELLSDINPGDLPSNFTEQLRIFVAVWRSLWGRLQSRENREIFHVRVDLRRDVRTVVEIVPVGLRFGRVMSVAARLLNGDDSILSIQLTRSNMKRREDPLGARDATYKHTLRSVRSVASGVLPEGTITRAFDDLPPEGPWEISYERQNGAPATCVVDLFVEVAHIT